MKTKWLIPCVYKFIYSSLHHIKKQTSTKTKKMIIMIGCYGNSAEDRYRENQLDEYLSRYDEPEVEEDEIDNPCEYCGEESKVMETYTPENCNGNDVDLLCFDCRKTLIGKNNGIRGYYAKFNIQSVELI